MAPCGACTQRQAADSANAEVLVWGLCLRGWDDSGQLHAAGRLAPVSMPAVQDASRPSLPVSLKEQICQLHSRCSSMSTYSVIGKCAVLATQAS